MKLKKTSKFKEAFYRVVNFRYSRTLNNAREEIENLAAEEDGFLVPFGDRGDDREPVRISRMQFEKAFHEDIWYNMHPVNQVATLMWLDGYFASKDGRKEAIIDIDFKAEEFEVKLEDDDFIFVIPSLIFEEDKMFPFDFANRMVNMCVEAKGLDRKLKYEKTGEITDLSKEYLESLNKMPTTPACYKRFIDNKPLTSEEKLELKEHLSQPYIQEFRTQIKELDQMADRNEVYVGYDSLYEGYKEELEYSIYLEDDFLKNFNEKSQETIEVN
jgi:hypothetical protein